MIDRFRREILSEGRDYGYSFGFATKTNNRFVSLTPFSCCKDYLNDFVQSQHTQEASTVKYGFINIPQIYDNIYLGFKIANNRSNNWKSYDTFRKEFSKVDPNQFLLELNKFETELGYSSTEEIIKDNNYIVIPISYDWFLNTYRISLLTLFIRLKYSKVLGEDKGYKKYIDFKGMDVSFLNDDIDTSRSYDKVHNHGFITKIQKYNKKEE